MSDWEVGFLLMEATRMTLEARIDAIEKRIASLEESLKTRMDSLEKRMDMLEKRIEVLEKRIEGLESDMKQLRVSMDNLRDLIIARLVEALIKKWHFLKYYLGVSSEHIIDRLKICDAYREYSLLSRLRYY